MLRQWAEIRGINYSHMVKQQDKNTLITAALITTLIQEQTWDACWPYAITKYTYTGTVQKYYGSFYLNIPICES